MSNFKGTNDFNLTRFAFYERVRYNIQAFEQKNFSNLKRMSIGELSYYGVIDTNYNTVYPDEAFLKNINSLPGQAMNFVVDAYNSVFEHFKTALVVEQISENEKYLSNLQVFSAYNDPITEYSNYIDNIFMTYNNDFLNENKIKKRRCFNISCRLFLGPRSKTNNKRRKVKYKLFFTRYAY